MKPTVAAGRSCSAQEVSQPAELGSPIKDLVRVFEEEHGDPLVVRARTRRAMRSVLRGSVAHEMPAVTPCPVVVPPHTVS